MTNDLSKSNSTLGQYRATQLWNDLVRTFRGGIPVGRHRRHLKQYEKSFVASDAISWLHAQLQNNPNFGDGVTRQQATQLLQKFHRAFLFEDARGQKYNKDDFTDNNRLYRLTQTEVPVVMKPATRMPLSTKNIDPHGGFDNEAFSNSICQKKRPLSKSALNLRDDAISVTSDITEVLAARKRTLSQQEITLEKVELNALEVENSWRKICFSELGVALCVDSIDDIIDTEKIVMQHMMHNMTHINKNGVVNNIHKKDQLPTWILSAMRVLAYWPNNVDDGLPQYPGFERDVFRVIVDYFTGLGEPLLTKELQQLFVGVYRRCEQIQEGIDEGVGLTSFQSVENLLSDLTVNGDEKGDEKTDQPAVPSPYGYLSDYSKNSAPYGRLPGQPSLSRLPGYCDKRRRSSSRVETSFGLDDNIPKTVVSRNPVMHRPQSAVCQLERQSHGRPGPRWRSSSNLTSSSSKTSSSDSNEDPDSTLTGDEARRENYGLTLSGQSPSDGSIGSDDVIIVNDPSPDERTTRVPPPYIPPPCYGALGMKRKQHSESSVAPKAVYQGLYYPQRHPDATRQPRDRSRDVTRSESRQSICSRPCLLPRAISRSESGSQCLSRALARSTPALAQARSRSSVSASYRQATTKHSSQLTPEGKSLFCRPRSAEILTLEQRLTSSLRLCCMTLPPANRRKLHLLLRLMFKMSDNKELELERDEDQNLRDLVLDVLAPCIVDGTLQRARQLVEFMVDNYADLMKVPQDFCESVQRQLEELKVSKQQVTSKVRMTSCASAQFCAKLSLEDYEEQKSSASDEALLELLEKYVSDENLSEKERKRKLKQFQKSHPEIYARRFPEEKKSSNKQTILPRPLRKFRNIRF